MPDLIKIESLQWEKYTLKVWRIFYEQVSWNYDMGINVYNMHYAIYLKIYQWYDCKNFPVH